MKIPGILGVMALPGAVLFPGAMLPLFIFEPRYRQMLADALAGDRMFAIGLREDDEDGSVHPIGGAGFIRACVANPDGTSRLILQGVSRVRFLEWLPGQPYDQARVAVLPTGAATPQLAGPLRAEVRKLCLSVLKGPTKEIGKILDGACDHGEFSDFVGANLVTDPAVRQRLMEETDSVRRLEILAAYLTALKASI
jgi:Lon protease-like protein